jgi:hypothetical protein
MAFIKMSDFGNIIDSVLKPKRIRGFRGLPDLGDFGMRSEMSPLANRPLVTFNPTLPQMPTMPGMGANRKKYTSPVYKNIKIG